jgi:hypothetical protein
MFHTQKEIKRKKDERGRQEKDRKEGRVGDRYNFSSLKW